MYPDEVNRPGINWTPEYPDKTPGRRPYGEQVLDLIDRVYCAGNILRLVAAEVVGKTKGLADLVFTGRWPFDHRDVVVTFVTKVRDRMTG